MVHFYVMNNKSKPSHSFSNKNLNSSENLSQLSLNQIIEKLKINKPITIYSKKFIESIQCEEKLFYNNKRAALYKTEMCRSFSEMGFCKYGDSCQFCHSETELRKIERHPKYKTEICKTFWLEGSCPYGKRCCFAHQENINTSKKDKLKINPSKNLTNPENADLTPFAMEMDDSQSINGDTPSIESVTEVYQEFSPINEMLSDKNLLDTKSSIRLEDSPIKELIKHKNTNMAILEELIPTKADNIFYGSFQKHYFTFNRYYKGEFEPCAPILEDTEYRSVWENNAVNIWVEDPLFFIAKVDLFKQ